MYTFLRLAIIVAFLGVPYSQAQQAISLDDYTLTYFPADTLSGNEKGMELCGRYFLLETNTRQSGGYMVLFAGIRPLFGPEVSAIIGQKYQSLIMHVPLENIRLIPDDSVIVPVLINPQGKSTIMLRMNKKDIAEASCLKGGHST